MYFKKLLVRDENLRLAEEIGHCKNNVENLRYILSHLFILLRSGHFISTSFSL